MFVLTFFLKNQQISLRLKAMVMRWEAFAFISSWLSYSVLADMRAVDSAGRHHVPSFHMWIPLTTFLYADLMNLDDPHFRCRLQDWLRATHLIQALIPASMEDHQALFDIWCHIARLSLAVLTGPKTSWHKHCQFLQQRLPLSTSTWFRRSFDVSSFPLMILSCDDNECDWLSTFLSFTDALTLLWGRSSFLRIIADYFHHSLAVTIARHRGSSSAYSPHGGI